MNGQHPLSANKSGCLSVGGDVLLQVILLLWHQEEREVPAWSRPHPLLIEHHSLLVMDVRKPCSCMGTNGGDGGNDRQEEMTQNQTQKLSDV